MHGFYTVLYSRYGTTLYRQEKELDGGITENVLENH